MLGEVVESWAPHGSPALSVFVCALRDCINGCAQAASLAYSPCYPMLRKKMTEIKERHSKTEAKEEKTAGLN